MSSLFGPDGRRLPQKPDRLRVTKLRELDPQQAAVVRFLAKKGHAVCNGTGVSGWEDDGRSAVLCMCVRKKATNIEPFLEKVGKDIAAEIERRKSEATGGNGEVQPGTVPPAEVPGS